MRIRILAQFALAVALAASASAAESFPLAKVADYRLSEGRYGAAAVVDGDYLYVLGGSNDTGTRLDEIERLNLATGEIETYGRLEIPRRYHRAVLFERKIFVLGGNSGRLPGPQNLFEDSVEVVDLATRKITFVAPMPVAKAHFGCVLVDGRIFVLGGERLRGRSGSTTNSTEIYDIATNQWTTGPSLPAPQQGVAAVVDGSIIVAGGFSGLQKLDTVVELNPRTNAWGMLPRLCEAVSAHSLVVLGHYLLLIGNYDSAANMVAYDLNDRSSASFSLKDDLGWHTAAAVHQGRIYVVGGAIRSHRPAVDHIQVFELARRNGTGSTNP